MEHNPLFDRLWGMDGSHPFGNPYEMEERWRKMTEEIGELSDDEDLETEVCEFIKGDFKTTIVCKFNKLGYMVSHITHIENMAEANTIMKNLRDELFRALDEERYEDAKEYQDHINKLRHSVENKGKPTF